MASGVRRRRIAAFSAGASPSRVTGKSALKTASRARQYFRVRIRRLSRAAAARWLRSYLPQLCTAAWAATRSRWRMRRWRSAATWHSALSYYYFAAPAFVLHFPTALYYYLCTILSSLACLLLLLLEVVVSNISAKAATWRRRVDHYCRRPAMYEAITCHLYWHRRQSASGILASPGSICQLTKRITCGGGKPTPYWRHFVMAFLPGLRLQTCGGCGISKAKKLASKICNNRWQRREMSLSEMAYASASLYLEMAAAAAKSQ